MRYNFNVIVIGNFCKVVQLGNITNAAEELHVAQPTLSRQISSLEDSLGLKLLERAKTGVYLTAAGRTFYQQCLQFLESYEKLVSAVSNLRDIIDGSLTIGFQKSSERMIIDFNSKFFEKYPKISIRTQSQGEANFVDELENGSLDAVYIYGEELKRNYRNIQSVQVGMLKNMLLLSKNNPLSKRKSVNFTELRYERFVMPSKTNSPMKSKLIMDACQKNGFSPQCVATAEKTIDFVMNVLQYDGIAILPFMSNMDDYKGVCYVPLENYPVDYPIHLAWSATNTNNALPIYRSFIESQPIIKMMGPDNLEYELIEKDES